ncbi:MAG: hypothetical protein K0S33_2052 [Bacteroidetes bacterium]|jgi:hypothetical protein|nr:hypothetical protein [Bacteroidota bacterium]
MKKRLLLYAVTLLTSAANAQHLQVNMNYNADIPLKQTMPMMSMNHGMGLFIGYRMSEKVPFAITSDLSIGSFAYKSRKEKYTFSDGSVTETYVNYSSNMSKFLFGLNYDLGRQQNLFSGYITAQAGYALMDSRISIEDPNDPDGCTPLENKNTFRYGGAIYAAGGGIRINIKQLSKKPDGDFRHFIDIGVKYMGGGTFNYVNIKHMQESTHGMTSPVPSQPVREDTRDFNVQFVNVTTNDIHEHKVAEIYSSKFEMLNLKIGYMIQF